MAYNTETLLPYIPPADYDKIATEFLETYFPEALYKPQLIPILDIARNEMGLDVKFICLSEEQDIKNLQRTLDLLEDDDDVQYVWHNWDE